MKDKYSEQQSASPPRELVYVLIFGVAAGVVSVILNISITLSNLPTFQLVAREGDRVSYNPAHAVDGLQCLHLSITRLISLDEGYLVARVPLQRRLGVHTDMLTGI